MERPIFGSAHRDVEDFVAEQALCFDFRARIETHLLLQARVDFHDQLQVASGVGVGRQELDVFDAPGELARHSNGSADAQTTGVGDEAREAIPPAEEISRLSQLENRNGDDNERDEYHHADLELVPGNKRGSSHQKLRTIVEALPIPASKRIQSISARDI